MLAIARKNAIRQKLQEQKSIQITEMAELLGVTNETIRRDLREMEKDGDLIRTHGGAYISEGDNNDIDINTRQVLATAEKKIIAQKCDAIIQDGDYIYLDGSTTCWFIAKQIINRKLTVLTSSLAIANILSASKSVKLQVVGGEFSKKTLNFIGEGAQRNLERYYVDKAIISCRCVNMNYGITDTSDASARLHQVALEHARKKYLVVDNSKLNNISFVKAAPLDILDGIVMDCDFPEDWARYLKEHNIQIY